MVEITYQMVLSTLQTVSLMIGVIYYIFIMRNSQKTRELSLKAQELALETRQAELYMRLWEKWNTKEFSEIRFDAWNMKHKDHDDFIEQYYPLSGSHPEAKHLFGSWVTFARTIGGLATLRRKNLIKIDFLDGAMINDIYNWWYTFGLLVSESIEKGTQLFGAYVPFIKEVIDYDRIRRPWWYDKDSGEPRRPSDTNQVLTWVKPEDVIELMKKVYQ